VLPGGGYAALDSVKEILLSVAKIAGTSFTPDFAFDHLRVKGSTPDLLCYNPVIAWRSSYRV